MAIGIIGGTFDPPHYGHLKIALAALESQEVRSVIFIPASTPPHKISHYITPDTHRLNMVRLMLSNYPDLTVSDIELRRPGLSYTIDTINELKELHPKETLRLIIGADMANIFGTWKDAAAIIAAARPLIAARPGYEFTPGFGITEPHELSVKDRKILLQSIFPAPLTAISSTELRDAVVHTEKKILHQNLDIKVLEYINRHNLYK